MNQTAIGAYIALLRQRRGFTQRALAAQLGVSCHAVSKWERRTSLPDVPGLTRLALALNTSADALLGIDPARIRAEVLQAAEDCTTLLNKGNAEAAVRLLREKAARYPHEPELKVCLARALLALKTDADLREALALCPAADGQPMA